MGHPKNITRYKKAIYQVKKKQSVDAREELFKQQPLNITPLTGWQELEVNGIVSYQH